MMISKFRYLHFLITITLFSAFIAIVSFTFSQQSMPKSNSKNSPALNRLFQYNTVSHFIDKRTYIGTLTYEKLLGKGDFGLAAPNLINGEVTIVDGKIYQSLFNGETIEPSMDEMTSLAFVTQFNPKAAFPMYDVEMSEFENLILQRLDINELSAIKVTGDFQKLQLRSYQPVNDEILPSFSKVAQNQKVYEAIKSHGLLVGFYFPPHLKGINVEGFHFHFITQDRSFGGHVLDFKLQEGTIEIDRIDGSLCIEIL